MSTNHVPDIFANILKYQSPQQILLNSLYTRYTIDIIHICLNFFLFQIAVSKNIICKIKMQNDLGVI